MSKDYDRAFDNMNKVLKDMDNVFKEMDKVFKQVDELSAQVSVPRKMELGPWKPWFAWRPIKFKGKRVWMKKIYRRTINTYVDMEDWTRYEYGDIFDVIKDAK